MQKVFTTITVIAALGAASSVANAQEILTGDKRLACEAILCLASGQRPSECDSALKRYFSIKSWKPSTQINKRRSFLQLCPAAKEEKMASLVDAMARGAGQCDAASLNQNRIIVQWGGGDGGEIVSYVSNQKPGYCSIYETHEYTAFGENAVHAGLENTLPRYVGTPEKGGFWVETKDYAEALDAYNAQQKAERDREFFTQNNGGQQ